MHLLLCCHYYYSTKPSLTAHSDAGGPCDYANLHIRPNFTQRVHGYGWCDYSGFWTVNEVNMMFIFQIGDTTKPSLSFLTYHYLHTWPS